MGDDSSPGSEPHETRAGNARLAEQRPHPHGREIRHRWPHYGPHRLDAHHHSGDHEG
ncbi:hypothetical protein B0T14DRAFT_522611 [Immersiella caudata]|uniref:Uncharacterized protein n=1 Tax=Immersiella caudata TaxID=314043 RepID=A0AA39WT41_9PEZI|nr:hypothetical protein B0T14DRAFT_522611 [Immersiella caudata]